MDLQLAGLRNAEGSQTLRTMLANKVLPRPIDQLPNVMNDSQTIPRAAALPPNYRREDCRVYSPGLASARRKTGRWHLE